MMVKQERIYSFDDIQQDIPRLWRHNDGRLIRTMIDLRKCGVNLQLEHTAILKEKYRKCREAKEAYKRVYKEQLEPLWLAFRNAQRPFKQAEEEAVRVAEAEYTDALNALFIKAKTTLDELHAQALALKLPKGCGSAVVLKEEEAH